MLKPPLFKFVVCRLSLNFTIELNTMNWTNLLLAISLFIFCACGDVSTGTSSDTSDTTDSTEANTTEDTSVPESMDNEVKKKEMRLMNIMNMRTMTQYSIWL